MKKSLSGHILLLCVLFSLTGCAGIGNKAMNMSVIYGITTMLSLFLLVCYCALKKKESWFVVLFSSVLVVNIGYFALSVSDTLDMALWANRISYLGSVFLPMSMFFTIMKSCRIPYKKWLVGALTGVSLAVFLIAASPGVLDIYYKEVSLVTVNGVSTLDKEYGPWHSIYLYYLFLYFAAMICVAIVSAVKKRLNSPIHAAVIIAAVFANICVWLLEQLVNINFEFLSVSYIISELFLLGIYMIIRETEKMLVAENSHAGSPDNGHNEIQEPSDEQCGKAGLHEQCVALLNNLPLLTPTERLIYDMYIDGKSTKEVLENLGIKENTLKFHNKNIYSKLGVSSRKQLIGIARLINDEKPE